MNDKAKIIYNIQQKQMKVKAEELQKRIFSIKSESEFESISLDIFKFQYDNIHVYQEYCDLIEKNPSNVKSLFDIPFLPIEFYKTHKIFCKGLNPEIKFTSSGTTGMITSNHHVYSLDLYRKSFLKSFELFYGDIQQYKVLALLPAYLERDGSSLVWMANEMIKLSNQKESGFYLYNYDELVSVLETSAQKNEKVLLLGVTFALLDIAEKYQLNLPQTIIMETGGMKGRRKEIVRDEMHSILRKSFGVNKIHSEYGMAEMLSQAYSKGDGIFNCPSWMKILVRDTDDPYKYIEQGKTGGLNIIDLANLYSCSFLESKDLGKLYSDNSFEVLGRFDSSDIRGCNLLVVE